MTDPILVACAYCRRSTLPDDINGLLCAVCLVPYAKGAWRSRASEGDYAERIAFDGARGMTVTGTGHIEYVTASANILNPFAAPPYPDDRALGREQAQIIADLQKAAADSRSHQLQEGRQRERADMELRLAWALFRERVTPEAKLRAERNRNVESVVRTMWNTTRTADRDECLARAAVLFKAMLALVPKEEGPF